MLYVPFRDEEEEFRPDDSDFIEKLYMANKQRIRKVKSKIMEHLESVEEARHYVQEVKKNLDLTLEKVSNWMTIGVISGYINMTSNCHCK